MRLPALTLRIVAVALASLLSVTAQAADIPRVVIIDDEGRFWLACTEDSSVSDDAKASPADQITTFTLPLARFWRADGNVVPLTEGNFAAQVPKKDDKFIDLPAQVIAQRGQASLTTGAARPAITPAPESPGWQRRDKWPTLTVTLSLQEASAEVVSDEKPPKLVDAIIGYVFIDATSWQPLMLKGLSASDSTQFVSPLRNKLPTLSLVTSTALYDGLTLKVPDDSRVPSFPRLQWIVRDVNGKLVPDTVTGSFAIHDGKFQPGTLLPSQYNVPGHELNCWVEVITPEEKAIRDNPPRREKRSRAPKSESP